MNVALIIILVVVAALIVGPVMMLKPRPAQRRREQLRLQARALGLRFSMRSLPRLKTDMDAPEPLPCYCLEPEDGTQPVAEWLLMRTAYSHEKNFYQTWDWVGRPPPGDSPQLDYLRQQIVNIPDSVKALSQSAAGLCCFWNEREGEEQLEALVALLRKLAQLAQNPE